MEVINLSDESEGEDVVITDVRQAPEGLTLMLPDGPLVVTGAGREPEPERASFGGQVHGPDRTARAAQASWRSSERLQRNQREQREQRRLRQQQQRLQGPQRHQRTLRAQQELQMPIVRMGVANLVRRAQVFGRLHGLFVDDEEDEDYYPGMELPVLRHVWQHPVADDEVPQDLMEMIQRREEAEFDKKREKNLDGTAGVQREMDERVAAIKEPFTTKIDQQEEYVCPLCAVTLGVGIPDDFTSNRASRPLPAWQESEDVRAPFRALELVTAADRDLSKRVFVARCGHTYCGRCVRNISKAREMKGRRYKREENDITNLYVCSPKQCIGADCSKRLTGKTAFVEVFL